MSAEPEAADRACLYELDAKVFIREFPIGFHVVARRVSNDPVRVSHPYAEARA